MKKTIFLMTAVAVLLGTAHFSACKKAETETATLKVILSVGVTGTPVAGDYVVQIGEEKSYSYGLEAGYNVLTVVLDGKPIDASGTFTVSGDHVLQAYSEGNIQYSLAVTVEPGVTGTPASGTYYYAAGTEVPYSYALDDGYSDLDVKLDGVSIAASGSFAMDKDRSVLVLAEKVYNVLGQWKIEETYRDGSDFEVVADFSGALSQGTVTDSQGGSGSFKVDGGEIEFDLKFPDVTYEYSGVFLDDNSMDGTCKRYRSSDAVVAGEWTATRVTSTAAAAKGSANKYRR